MRRPQFRIALPWQIGLSLVASLACLCFAAYLGFAARTDAIQTAGRQLAGQADRLANQIDRDIVEYDLTLREAANQLPTRAPGAAPPPLKGISRRRAS